MRTAWMGLVSGLGLALAMGGVVTADEGWVGLVTAVQGPVQMDRRPVRPLTQVHVGDRLHLASGDRVTVAFLQGGQRDTAAGPGDVVVQEHSLQGATVKSVQPVRYRASGMPSLSNNDRLGGFVPGAAPAAPDAIQPPAAVANPPAAVAPVPQTSALRSSLTMPPVLSCSGSLELHLLHPGTVPAWKLTFTNGRQLVHCVVPGGIGTLDLSPATLQTYGGAWPFATQPTCTLSLEGGETVRLHVLTPAENASITAGAKEAEAAYAQDHDPAEFAVYLGALERLGAYSLALQQAESLAQRHPEQQDYFHQLTGSVHSEVDEMRKRAHQ